MRLLLDTNAVIWLLSAPRLLSRRVLDLVGDVDTAVHFSAVNIWEIGVKSTAGRLELAGDPIAEIRERGGHELPITFEHAARSAALPRHHGDPFDRILVAQAQLERLTLVTSDRRLHNYEIEILPARD